MSWPWAFTRVNDEEEGGSNGGVGSGGGGGGVSNSSSPNNVETEGWVDFATVKVTCGIPMRGGSLISVGMIYG
jgi:hypothetical protein